MGTRIRSNTQVVFGTRRGSRAGSALAIRIWISSAGTGLDLLLCFLLSNQTTMGKFLDQTHSLMLGKIFGG